MAAAGSAVGLGNIWGFPTQTASNGGGAFVLVYFILAFCLAYPALMAELIIGRHARANVITALRGIATNATSRLFGTVVGSYGVLVASLILSFYAIVAGWMLAFLAEPALLMLGFNDIAHWFTEFGIERNLITAALFMVVTMSIIGSGIEDGIEKWSTRLMPLLLGLMLALIIYVMTQDGAMEGLAVYLTPDIRQINGPLIIDAMGQAFFSLSLGVGTMLIYGSYLSREESLPKLGAMVTLVDCGIAFFAGLLIIPAMYVAQAHGTQIFTDAGDLISSSDLVFQVLPSLFHSMGDIGPVVALTFFALMSVAALTSSISMLEVPVSLTTEKTKASRPQATLIIGLAIFAVSTLIIFNFDCLFGFVIDLTTVYSQPLLGLALCIFTGWIWHRDNLLKEIEAGHPDIAGTLFWKIWPVYVKFFCPILIIAAFTQSIL